MKVLGKIFVEVFEDGQIELTRQEGSSQMTVRLVGGQCNLEMNRELLEVRSDSAYEVLEPGPMSVKLYVTGVVKQGS